MTCVRPLATLAALSFAVACAPAADPNQLRVSGHVEATEVRLAPEMGGRVLTLDVKEGDRVVVHYRWKGVNSGAMGEGMPATNKPIDVETVDVLRFENGKVVEHWGYMEEMKMMEQLGMMGGEEEGKK